MLLLQRRLCLPNRNLRGCTLLGSHHTCGGMGSCPGLLLIAQRPCRAVATGRAMGYSNACPNACANACALLGWQTACCRHLVYPSLRVLVRPHVRPSVM